MAGAGNRGGATTTLATVRVPLQTVIRTDTRIISPPGTFVCKGPGGAAPKAGAGNREIHTRISTMVPPPRL
jgi:hypothetical protein